MAEADFEKLGVFYLGRRVEPQGLTQTDELCLYDSKDLVTHAVCIGMTGSGKTGLCLGLIEEAAIDGIPVIAIDPKGDIGNLLLTFPQLRPEDFEPWVDADQAQRAGMSVAQFAAQQAAQWKEGLQNWQETGQRIAKLRESADFAIYTPGSSAGISVSIAQSFIAPPATLLADEDALQERITTCTSSLLGLLGIDADPLRSREHILIANVVKEMWLKGKDVTLSALIQLIQKPPLKQLGAIDIESFYPAKERFQLAMSLNNLLASPGFDTWLKGQPLDIDHILHTPDGKPRVAIFSTAHLDDAQRMFFTTLLLNQMLAWMRAQSGTTSLRCVFYMDELFGYFPPTASPPSKRPLLTLMKQARAFGLGVVLATQNPVDIDYKGLSNAGTWFIGRLQTERDKMRVLDGLEGAAADSGTGFDRSSLDRLLSKLGSRVFLMNNVHNHEPVLFQSRWTLSYLRGPLNRTQIKTLMSAQANSANTHETAATQAQTRDVTVKESVQPVLPSGTTYSDTKPVLAPGIRECFLPLRQVVTANARLIYKPRIIAVGNVRFSDAKSSVDSTLQYTLLSRGAQMGMPSVDWQQSEPAKVWMEQLSAEGEAQAEFEPLADAMGDQKAYALWTKDFALWLYNTKNMTIFKSELTDDYSKPRETERDFRIRLTQAARERRDEAASQLKARYAAKLSALQQRLQKAQNALEKEEAEARDEQIQSAISVGATVLGAFMGRKGVGSRTIDKATTAARRVGKASQEQLDVQHAQETVEALTQQLAQLNAEFQDDLSALTAKYDPLKAELTKLSIAPKKTNINVALMALAWAPYLRDESGGETPAWYAAGSR